MGFFSSLWKGVKKVFKKIGKAIKRVTKGIGKFVGKLGIVGQIGMFFIMPHVAGFLMKGLSGAVAALTGAGTSMGGLGGALVKGFGTVLDTAHRFATSVGNTFGTITEGISQFAKTGLSKLGFNIEGAATNFFGNDSAWSRTLDKAGTIFDPFKGVGTSFGDKTLSEFSNQTGISEANLTKLNPELQGLGSDSLVPEGIYTTDVSKIGIGVPKGPLETQVTSGISEGADIFGDAGVDISGVTQKTEPAGFYEQSYTLTPDGQGVVEGTMEYGLEGEYVPKTFTPTATSGTSLLSSAGSSLRKSFETDPLRTTERILGVAQQAQQLGYEEPDVFYGGGAQTQYLYEPSLGYQNVELAQVDPSQGIYGYNAFSSGESYDWSQNNPYWYYMQQQQRYAA